MGNNLNIDIEGRFVLLRPQWFADRKQGRDIRERVFLAKGGFGCSATTMGNAVFGEFVVDGEEVRVEGYDLSEDLASKSQVEAALAERDRRHLAGNAEMLAALVNLPSDCEVEFGLDHDHDEAECARILDEMNGEAMAQDDYGMNREAEEQMLGRPLFPNEY